VRPRGLLLGGQARADVEELADALVGQVLHRADEETPIRSRALLDIGRELQQLLRDRAIDGEVLLSPEEEVVDAGRAGHVGVDARRNLFHGTPHRRALMIFKFWRSFPV